MASSGTRLPLPIVYVATNTSTRSIYIGVTAYSLNHRRNAHFHAARRETDKGRSRFYNAIRKYGARSFIFHVLYQCRSYKEALGRERSLIQAYRPEYHVTMGGEGAPGYRHTPETLKLLSEMRKGTEGPWRGKKRPDVARKNSERLKANPLRFWLGKTRSEETKQKISRSKTGKRRGPINALQKEIFAENMRRAARARCKAVKCLNDGRVFDSATAAGDHYGLSNLAAAAVANGRRNAVFGLKFEYVENSR